MTQSVEINLDGLIGPTHTYSGLSYGNVASMEHGQQVSNPKQAALQGLEKMKTLTNLGVKQVVLPPHERPFIPILRSLGYTGSDVDILAKVAKSDPNLLMACSSAAPMWAANIATTAPSVDALDGRLHFTPANLISKFHRSFEGGTTAMILHRIFSHPAYFAHHHPLPYHLDYADEGGANHTRFCRTFDQPGIHLFVFGRSQSNTLDQPKRYPARQTEEASRAVARLHRLTPNHVLFAQQNPEAIDAGVFHNDVISVGHQNLFLYHEKAFVDSSTIIQQLKNLVETYCQVPFIGIEVKEREVSLEEAVKTYLFNSQIVTLQDQSMALIAPEECRRSINVNRFLQQLIDNRQQPICQIIYQNIRESMQNGGGPACLRLRVVISQNELKEMHPHVLLTDTLYEKLKNWIEEHYRDRLTPNDLADPGLLQESYQALDELAHLLQLGPIYPFQRGPPPPLPEKRS